MASLNAKESNTKKWIAAEKTGVSEGIPEDSR